MYVLAGSAEELNVVVSTSAVALYVVRKVCMHACAYVCALCVSVYVGVSVCVCVHTYHSVQ